jgi:LAO/AO transport system kinase
MSTFDSEKWINNRRNFKQKMSVEYLFDGIIEGNTSILSNAITIIESQTLDDERKASELIEKCLPYSGKSQRIGITGVPGVGKSTFIEVFGKYLIEKGKKVAVLSVDPSSEISQGSILGDKTRMEGLSKELNAYVRPSASGNQLGGVARSTRESIILCEAAGFDVILIETVGVGQSETLVHSMVDFFLLLMLAGAGDELQGIKRGIMELADSIVITKADGEYENEAKRARVSYKQALHYFPINENGWTPKVLTYSCFKKGSLTAIYNEIDLFFNDLTQVELNRKKQASYWVMEYVKQLLFSEIKNNNKIEFEKLTSLVERGEIESFQAAKEIVNIIKTKNERD